MPEPVKMPYYGGHRTIFKRDAALVRIETDSGFVGYGPAPASESVVELINGELGEALIGEDTLDIEQLRDEILEEADQAEVNAFGPLEIALYDLKGKIENCPVYELLGGKRQDRIRLYGSAGMYQAPEEYAREAAEVAKLGFLAYKMRPALGPEEDLRTIRLIREAVSHEVGICVDAHAWWRMGDKSYSPRQIEKLARQIAEYNITWLEEPLPPEDRKAYARLRNARILPIAAGEHEASLDGFDDMISHGTVDICQADVPHHGGFTIVGMVLEMCEEYEIEFAFHNWGTQLETLADAHLGVCFPSSVAAWLEYPCYSHRGQKIMYPYPLADEILKTPLQVEDGYMLLPKGPGLGIEVDESVVERYPFIPGPWSIFRLHSPPEEWALSGDHAIKWEKK